jgi:hypothetical protein
LKVKGRGAAEWELKGEGWGALDHGRSEIREGEMDACGFLLGKWP